MQPYQEEYLANLKEIAALTARKKPDGLSFAAYELRLRQNEGLVRQRVKRNVELLRGGLVPALDHLFEIGEEQLRELSEFAACLMDSATLDMGLFRLIHQALLTLARRKGDRAAAIRELYWLGMGYYGLCSGLAGLELELVEKYYSRMRLCFTEAAAYLKYFDEIEDTETRGYILRSRGNMALGVFKSPGEKIRLVRETLQILQDEHYREKAPELPWDRYLYMTHQQMASSITHNKEKVMTPEDTASIMESVYIVYQQRIQEAAARHEKPSVRWTFPYCAIEYYCGLCDFGRLLSHIEQLLDAADVEDHSPDSVYAVVSLPAFYCQYLAQEPERIPGRAAYVDGLYRRALDYVDSFPASEDEKLALYLWQLSCTYIETGGGMSYGAFLQKIMLRFAPGLYLHCWMVGTAARAMCQLILEEEPGFFDDMEGLQDIRDPEEKRRTILHSAMQSGLLHDAGKVSLLQFYAQTGRQWLGDEYEVARLHPVVGETMLAARASTRPFAAAALGHHAWYDGTAHGYPASYKRLECPSRQIVDVVSLMDWLDNVTHSGQAQTGIEMTFEEAVEEAVALEGRRFSPMLTARLRDKQVVVRICQAFSEGRREAYRQMYNQEWGAGQEE
ncbi:MAG: hypothetical protein K2O45_04025 [Oscillospiraceae bacterium]|nr:hypothetical protein [Oscillospiraceae bacterium]